MCDMGDLKQEKKVSIKMTQKELEVVTKAMAITSMSKKMYECRDEELEILDQLLRRFDNVRKENQK